MLVLQQLQKLVIILLKVLDKNIDANQMQTWPRFKSNLLPLFAIAAKRLFYKLQIIGNHGVKKQIEGEYWQFRVMLSCGTLLLKFSEPEIGLY